MSASESTAASTSENTDGSTVASTSENTDGSTATSTSENANESTSSSTSNSNVADNEDGNVPDENIPDGNVPTEDDGLTTIEDEEVPLGVMEETRTPGIVRAQNGTREVELVDQQGETERFNEVDEDGLTIIEDEETPLSAKPKVSEGILFVWKWWIAAIIGAITGKLTADRKNKKALAENPEDEQDKPGK